MQTPVTTLLGRKTSSALRSLPPSATVADAVRLMNAHRLGSALVLAEGWLAGIFTERDVLTRVVGMGRDPRTTPLADVMTRNPMTVSPTATVEEVMEIITVRRVRRLPVVDATGAIMGVLSIGDVTRWLVDTHRAEAEHLRNYIGTATPF